MRLPWAQKSNDPGSGPSTSAPSQAAAGVTSLNIHGTPVPLNYLVKSHDPKKYPAAVLTTPAKQKQTMRNVAWAASREQIFAAAAAGVHLAAFAYNLAFWGFEGMPPDRYWPPNTRLKMGVKPGRFGNLDGTKRVWYDNLSAMEGV